MIRQCRTKACGLTPLPQAFSAEIHSLESQNVCFVGEMAPLLQVAQIKDGQAKRCPSFICAT
jgi:hypothetical protein